MITRDPTIRKLQTKTSKLDAKNVSLEAEMVAARLRIKEYEKKYKADDGKPQDPVETARWIAFILNQGGFDLVEGKVVQVHKPS